MFELRFGSYSMAATFAGTPTLSRRKSTVRYCFLCPPPRCQITISPWLFRPPERFFGSSSAFSGSCLVMWLLSTTVMNRRDAVYGLKLFSPIAASYLLTSSPLLHFTWLTVVILSEAKDLNVKYAQSLQVLRVFDHLLALGELHIRLLPITPVAFVLAAAAHLAHKICRADARDFHFENLLDRFLDLRLRRAGENFKNHRVLRLFHAETFFGDDRPPNDLIVMGRHRLSLPLFLGRLRGLLRCRRFLGCGFRRSFFFRRFRRRCNRRHVGRARWRLLGIERVAQSRHDILREHQQVMFQHVVGLQNVSVRQRYPFDVAARGFQGWGLAVSYPQGRLFLL